VAKGGLTLSLGVAWGTPLKIFKFWGSGKMASK